MRSTASIKLEAPATSRLSFPSPRISTIVGGGFLLWGLAVGLIQIHDNSFLTHLATGRYILTHGIPHSDPYSFTAHGHHWVLESWLASVVYGVVAHVAGWRGLQLIHASLTVVMAAFVWMLSRGAVTLAGRVLAASFVLAVGTSYWVQRPLLMGLVLLGVVVLMAETEGGHPAVLLPVMWVWVNVHGSFPIALVYLVMRMAGRAVDRKPQGRLPALLAATATGTLLGAANPFGFALLGHPLLAITDHQAFARIAEWQSPIFSNPANLVFLVGAMVALLLLVVRRGSAEDAVIAVVFTAAACIASRNVVVAALVILPVLARGLAGLGSVVGAKRYPAGLLALALIGMLCLMVLGGAVRQSAYNLGLYPVAEVTWMQHHDIVPGRVATPDYVGNYLEYRFGVTASAFIDDRVDMYPQAVERAASALLAGSPRWQHILDRYRINAVLWPTKEPLAGLVSENRAWRIVLHNRRWTVAVRR